MFTHFVELFIRRMPLVLFRKFSSPVLTGLLIRITCPCNTYPIIMIATLLYILFYSALLYIALIEKKNVRQPKLALLSLTSSHRDVATHAAALY